MKGLDRRFWANKWRYLLQCALAMFAVLVVLLILDAIKHTTIIAALGASAFIAFAMPHARIARPRFLLGGYLVGLIVGCTCHYLSILPLFASLPSAVQLRLYVVFGGLAVGLAIFLMVVADVEHPPAAGLALGFVLNEWDAFTVLVVAVGIISLVGIKALLRPILVDLI